MRLRALWVSNNGSDLAAVLQVVGLFFSFLFFVFAFLRWVPDEVQCTQLPYSILHPESQVKSNLKTDSTMDMTQVLLEDRRSKCLSPYKLRTW